MNKKKLSTNNMFSILDDSDDEKDNINNDKNMNKKNNSN